MAASYNYVALTWHQEVYVCIVKLIQTPAKEDVIQI